MCSIADGLRSSNSTVACIASITEPKKMRPRPFSAGNAEIFNSAEKIAASVPSLPARISFRLFGARENCSKPFDPGAGPAFEQTRRPALGHFGSVSAHEIVDLVLFVEQRFVR